MAVRLVSLVCDVVLRSPVGLVVGYGVLTNFAVAASAAWMQCGWSAGRRRTPGRGARPWSGGVG
jgi:hypothetical protein